jgi:hypothetical protein
MGVRNEDGSEKKTLPTVPRPQSANFFSPDQFINSAISPNGA